MPDDVRVEFQRQLAPYRRAYGHVRWTRPQTWHLTLLFLGGVAPDRVPELERLIRDIAGKAQPYRVTVDQGGGRAGRGDGVAWLGLSEGADKLIETATLSAESCPPDITDDAPPRRTPSAHLTVVRKADETVVRALRDQSQGPLGVSWRVESLQLVRSHLDRHGARYETLHASSL